MNLIESVCVYLAIVVGMMIAMELVVYLSPLVVLLAVLIAGGYRYYQLLESENENEISSDSLE